jgi:type I restriction enzyme M protein
MSYIQEILKNSSYKLDLFSPEEIHQLDNRITPSKDKKDNVIYVVECLKRGSIIKLTPEEIVRQLFLNRILTHYQYPKDRIRLELPIQFGSDAKSKRGDIVIMDKDRPDVVYIIFELKKTQ